MGFLLTLSGAQLWNKPVYHFMRRHIYAPLVGRGVSPRAASIVVFTFSAFLHELLVGVPTHNIIGMVSYDDQFVKDLHSLSRINRRCICGNDVSDTINCHNGPT